MVFIFELDGKHRIAERTSQSKVHIPLEILFRDIITKSSLKMTLFSYLQLPIYQPSHQFDGMQCTHVVGKTPAKLTEIFTSQLHLSSKHFLLHIVLTDVNMLCSFC